MLQGFLHVLVLTQELFFLLSITIPWLFATNCSLFSYHCLLSATQKSVLSFCRWLVATQRFQLCSSQPRLCSHLTRKYVHTKLSIIFFQRSHHFLMLDYNLHKGCIFFTHPAIRLTTLSSVHLIPGYNHTIRGYLLDSDFASSLSV